MNEIVYFNKTSDLVDDILCLIYLNSYSIIMVGFTLAYEFLYSSNNKKNSEDNFA